METGNGRRFLPYAAVIVLVAILAFGAGALASFSITQLHSQSQATTSSATNTPARILSMADSTATVSTTGSGQVAPNTSGPAPTDPAGNTPRFPKVPIIRATYQNTPPGAPQNLQTELKPFWDTMQAVDSEYYGRPVDHQRSYRRDQGHDAIPRRQLLDLPHPRREQGRAEPDGRQF